MGRYLSNPLGRSDGPVSDVRYAVCNFGGSGGSYYRLLDGDFKPARQIPNLAPAMAPISVSVYASYGTVQPSGLGISLDPVFALGGAWSGPANTSGTSTYYDGALQQAINFGGATAAPSTSNSNYDHYTGRCGEFGHDRWNLNARGAILLPQRSPTFGVETKTEANDAFVNGDLTDGSLTLLLWSGRLYLTRRAEVETVVVSNGARGWISRFTVPGLPNGYFGTASYNRTRNELVILGGSSATSSSGMWLRLYRNLPVLDETSNLETILSAITPLEVAITWSGWTPAANAEAVGGATPVLTDNGDVYIGFFNASTALYVVRVPRTGDTTFGALVNAISFGVTTSYGRHNARGSGMQVMQTRDGSTVAFYSQYYYYGAGLGVITVNKRSSSARVMYADSQTSDGRSLLHWGASGFAVAFNASSSYSAASSGAVYGYDCAVQTATVSPTQVVLPIPNGYNTGGTYPFYVEVSV